jgi:uncharacterized membrane protein
MSFIAEVLRHTPIWVWIVFVTLIYVGYSHRFFAQAQRVTYSPATRTFAVPGSGVPLTLMMTIFFVRYAIAVMIAVKPSLRENAAFLGATSGAFGSMSGIFVARALRLVREQRNARAG